MNTNGAKIFYIKVDWDLGEIDQKKIGKFAELKTTVAIAAHCQES